MQHNFKVIRNANTIWGFCSNTHEKELSVVPPGVVVHTSSPSHFGDEGRRIEVQSQLG
jgi:hypothetical protein